MFELFWALGVLSPILQQGDDSGTAAAGGIVGGVMGVIVGSVIAGLFLMGMFNKAGKPAWAAFVPLYNYVVLLDIIGKPWWWIFGFLVPCLNIILIIYIMMELSKSFGKDALYTVALIIPCVNVIALAYLSYGPDQYVGPGGAKAA
jgi:hypothetical protein